MSDAQPNKYVRLATLYLRKQFQLNSNICSICKKKEYYLLVLFNFRIFFAYIPLFLNHSPKNP